MAAMEIRDWQRISTAAGTQTTTFSLRLRSTLNLPFCGPKNGEPLS